uniref:Deoxynucleotidyltransferase terminal-interacting protein 2 n=1 Tax=Drosophila rhopaloa TaxID=1041015 RepID=A0A6P4E0W9_DRORH
MDSMFLLDSTGHRDINDEQLSCIIYSREPQFPEKKEGIIGDDQQKNEIEFFGLRLNCKEVLNVVSPVPDKSKTVSNVKRHLEEVGEKVVENSKKPNLATRKRVSVLDHNATDMGMRRKIVEWNMKGSRRALNPDLDQRNALPTVGKRQQPILNRAERGKTKGSGWFNLPATEVTEDMRNDLKIIQMRSVLNPKQFYKKNDYKILPKFFQIGTVTHSALDNFKDKKARKTKSIVAELLDDEMFQKFNKKKYQEVIQRTDKYAQRKIMKKMKKFRKNK